MSTREAKKMRKMNRKALEEKAVTGSIAFVKKYKKLRAKEALKTAALVASIIGNLVLFLLAARVLWL